MAAVTRTRCVHSGTAGSLMSHRNQLFYGDNLGFLSDPAVFPSESVDLVYLDPPFNSAANYNVLFKEVSGEASAAQIRAFDDTWTWDATANAMLLRLMQDTHTPNEVKALVKTFHEFLGHSPMLAYLVQMSVRLVHLRRVLRPTGSLYLHCDPTASHFLKLVLDGVFGPENFLNEVVWKRTHSHGGARRYGPVHDTLLFYAASSEYRWNRVFTPYSDSYVEKFFRFSDKNGRYRLTILTGSGKRSGFSGKPWRGIDPTRIGRHWAIPGYVRELLPKKTGPTVQDALEALNKLGRVAWPKKKGGTPAFKQYLKDFPGVPLQDVWTDIPPISAQAAERLGYPTQKPLELLRRIVASSSNPGDVVLDPFCGCGTTIDAVESLNRESLGAKPRHRIGIDVTHLAINLIKSRLTRFDPAPNYAVQGEPVDKAGAGALFAQDRYQFQFWACGLVGARPKGAHAGKKQGKKGADAGIDGERYFVDDNTGPKRILIQVKGGKPGVSQVRDFRGTLEREGAALGIFVTLDEPTAPMLAEAASVAPYTPPSGGERTPRLQVVTIETLLGGGTPTRPNGVVLPRSFDSAADRTTKKAKLHDGGALFQAKLW